MSRLSDYITALEDAADLLEEVYSHTGPDGLHLPDKETKIWAHVSTVGRMGDVLAAVRGFEPDEEGPSDV